ncbi:MAG: hypothetical protein K2X93_09070 [Candidatus Obscuribacterales bacterium]|nr:hypothetical protein [Candidatus Obscuribacterales bacterium]
MTISQTVDLSWGFRDLPLIPQAVVAVGSGLSRALVKKLLKREQNELRKLQCVAGKELLLVLGDESNLPWLDGVVYLGQERNSSVYIPTVLQPSQSIALLERALLAANAGLKPPLVVLPSVSIVLSLSKPFIPDQETLKSCLEKI